MPRVVGTAHSKMRVPEVRNDPCAQQVVAEVTKRAVVDCRGAGGVVANGQTRTGVFLGIDTVVVASVDGVAIVGHSPVLSDVRRGRTGHREAVRRSEEHTSELQSLAYLVCRLLLEKKKRTNRCRP